MPGFQADIIGVGCPPALAQNINGVGVGGLTATGSTQVTALLVTACSNLFTTVAASTGAILPIVSATQQQCRAGAGDIIAIYNNGANPLAVYPPVGQSIGTLSANTAISVPAGKSGMFSPIGNGNYVYFLSA